MVAKDLIQQNKQKFIDELFDFLRIPSVSADSNHVPDMKKTALFLEQKLKDLKMDIVEIIETEGFPVVFASKTVDANLPTVLVYGHYDVQPPDPLNLWTSPPFEPVIKDEKIYARGACDDKGQVYMHLKAVETMLQTQGLPCNIKLMIEGEEEVGSPNLEAFLKTHKEKLKADVILVSDTAIFANDCPSIDVGLRGLSYLEVEVTAANRDLHSGTYGGGVANPINVLCEMIASLKDENHHITIPNFYDDVLELTAEERAELNRLPFDEKVYLDDLGLDALMGEAGFTTIERTGIRPTLDVNGIWGGYTGEGSKTVLPSKAFAKISMRLVPNQSHHTISKLFEEHFIKIAPKGVKVQVRPHHGGEPALTPTDSIAFKAASSAMEQVFGKKPIPTRGGGSIPIVSLFEKILGLKTVLMGFGLDTDAIHSPNEHYGLFNYFAGIETIALFHQKFAEGMKNK
jgi:acetylornithine deacetylase/succinyl-diaminopimelate desuccinylase-like protein